MPCACQIPVPEYPENAEWGPLLWNILHGLAQRAQGFYPHDEPREWVKIIKLTAEMLPCDKCREHMNEFIRKNPPTVFADSPELKTSVKTWFWSLHNEVNVRNGKPEFPFDTLSQYNTINLQDLLWRLDPVIKKAIQINGLGFLKYTKWIATIKMIRSMLMF